MVRRKSRKIERRRRTSGKLSVSEIKKLLDQVDKDFPRDRGFTVGSMATKAKAAQPKEDFETFRERVLLMARRDAPEPASTSTTARTEPATKSITLYYTNPSVNSDKVYTLEIVKDAKFKDAYFVNFSYGKRGKTLKSGTKTKIGVSYSEALNIYDYFLKEKKDEGYTENVSGKPYTR